jgi:hypothetical protein
VEGIDQFASEVFNVTDVEVLSAAKPRIKEIVQVSQDVNDRRPTRQRSVAEMTQLTAFHVVGDQGRGNIRQAFFQANIGSHVIPIRWQSRNPSAVGRIGGSPPRIRWPPILMVNPGSALVNEPINRFDHVDYRTQSFSEAESVPENEHQPQTV